MPVKCLLLCWLIYWDTVEVVICWLIHELSEEYGWGIVDDNWRKMSHRRWLDAWNFGFRMKRDCSIHEVNTKDLIGCHYWAADLCHCFRIYAKIRFSHDTALIILWPCFRTDRSGQTVQTQTRLLLQEQSDPDQGLHCLLFQMHHFDMNEELVISTGKTGI